MSIKEDKKGREGDLNIKETYYSTDYVSFFNLYKGPNHPGFNSLKTSNSLFDQFMEYQCHGFKKKDYTRIYILIVEDLNLLNRIEIYLNVYKFYSKDQIIVFDFLTRFVEEWYILRRADSQACLELLSFLIGTA